jgi:DNA topoisomerase-3
MRIVSLQVFTSVRGHLTAIDFEEPYRTGWRRCSPAELFTVPVVRFVPDSNKGLEKTLQREARGAQRLILWMDCDREGENICFEAADVCLSANPRLEVLRAHFSAMIPADIHAAIRNLRPPNRALADAVDARAGACARVLSQCSRR